MTSDALPLSSPGVVDIEGGRLLAGRTAVLAFNAPFHSGMTIDTQAAVGT